MYRTPGSLNKSFKAQDCYKKEMKNTGTGTGLYGLNLDSWTFRDVGFGLKLFDLRICVGCFIQGFFDCDKGLHNDSTASVGPCLKRVSGLGSTLNPRPLNPKP